MKEVIDMPKTVLMIRHAKAGWGGFSISDFERPLENSGKKDAENMGIRLRERKLNIQQFVSSTALRARTTAEIISKNYSGLEEKVMFHDNLYHASPAIIAHHIAHLNENWNTVAIVCHNPGITDFVNTLVPLVKIDDMPTCGVFAITADVDNWSSFINADKKFLFFDYPKLW